MLLKLWLDWSILHSMKRTIVLFILQVGLGTCQVMAQVPSVVLTPTSQRIDRDSSGYVRIRVNNIQNLHAYSVQVAYDPGVVRCRLVRRLGFFTTTTFFVSAIDSVNGRTTVNEAVLGTGGQSGSGDLAELKFFGLANGTATLIFTTADFRDTANQVIIVTTQGAQIQVGPPNVVGEEGMIPAGELKVENYPNPFSATGGSAFGGNPMTTIRYTLQRTGKTLVRIYSILGEEVSRFDRYDTSPGVRELVWDGHDAVGNLLPTGTYFVRVETETSVASTKVLLLR